MNRQEFERKRNKRWWKERRDNYYSSDKNLDFYEEAKLKGGE